MLKSEIFQGDKGPDLMHKMTVQSEIGLQSGYSVNYGNDKYSSMFVSTSDGELPRNCAGIKDLEQASEDRLTTNGHLELFNNSILIPLIP